MTNFRPIFENDWCGIENFIKDVLSPIFGEYEQGYDILTNDSDVREKAKNANITEIAYITALCRRSENINNPIYIASNGNQNLLGAIFYPKTQIGSRNHEPSD